MLNWSSVEMQKSHLGFSPQARVSRFRDWKRRGSSCARAVCVRETELTSLRRVILARLLSTAVSRREGGEPVYGYWRLENTLIPVHHMRCWQPVRLSGNLSHSFNPLLWGKISKVFQVPLEIVRNDLAFLSLCIRVFAVRGTRRLTAQKSFIVVKGI